MTRNDIEQANPGFLDKLALAAQHAVQSAPRRMLVSTLIAQALDESAMGLKTCGKNNFLGLKCPSDWTGPRAAVPTHEYINGVDTPVTAYFCEFDSLEDCCIFYGKHLCEVGVYAPALAMLDGGDPISDLVTWAGISMPLWEAFTRKLGSIYATNPSYGDNLVQIIRDCDLLGFELAA